MAKFYITTAIPYVNAKPHIGHALEFVQADVIARYHKIIGDEVLLLSGGDENAVKNVQAAEKAKKPIQEFIDENTKSFYELSKKLNVEFDVWQKGSDAKHHSSSQKLWELCDKKGDIFKKKYKGLYCVGCELFYTESELDKNGECFEHPGKKLDEVEEENYFFKLSKYQTQLEKLFSSGALEIVPTFRKNEMLEFLKRGLLDISISRSNERAKNWGVDVPASPKTASRGGPNDPSQKMYVWFDALNIYQSGIGFGSAEQNDNKNYNKWWPADLHVVGKGILKFHAIYWPAFLLSAGLKLPKKIFVHEYITVNNQKMSKTIGNVIDPIPLIEKYGADALRYYLLAKISPFSDGDFTESKLKETYNSDLANGLGNLVSRVAKLAENANFQTIEKRHSGKLNESEMHPESPTLIRDAGQARLAGASAKRASMTIFDKQYLEALSSFKFNDALFFIWNKITELDRFINDEKPWELLKTNDKRLKTVLGHAVGQIQEIAVLLKPFLPETADKIESQFKGPKITSQKPLFPRIS